MAIIAQKRAQEILNGSLDDAIVDPDVYGDPERYHALFAQLRREDPVHWTQPSQYRPFWTVTKHAHISEAQRQPAIFESGGRVMLATKSAEQKAVQHTGGKTQLYRGITALNGDEHTNIRNVTREWFLPRSINKLDAQIAQLAKHFVDRMQSLGGECDFVEDVALWYPLRVILTIFGLPEEAEPMLLRLSKEVNGANDPDYRRGESEGDHMIQVLTEAGQYFNEVAESRRRNPRDDLASIIANATVEGAPISAEMIFAYYLSITVAGHDTTSASVAAGLLQLIENPLELQKLRDDPAKLTSAIDEMIRWTAPVKHFFRTATRDYVLGGKQIKAGDYLLMCYPSACRDEDVFEEPNRFVVDRPANPHLAFGIGPHLCMGQYLARVEMAAFYREFLKRVDRFELAGDPVQSRTLFMGGLKRLPIRYRMRGDD